MDMELGCSDCPVMDGLRPLVSDTIYGTEYQFEQGIFRGKRAFGFGVFSDLSVEALYGIGGVDDTPYFAGILEVSR